MMFSSKKTLFVLLTIALSTVSYIDSDSSTPVQPPECGKESDEDSCNARSDECYWCGYSGPNREGLCLPNQIFDCVTPDFCGNSSSTVTTSSVDTSISPFLSNIKTDDPDPPCADIKDKDSCLSAEDECF